LLRHRVLGELAVYRVLHARGQIVEVEAVSVPGLEPGTPLRLTAAAVRAMRDDLRARDRPRLGVPSPVRRAMRALPRA
jgi:hypothetical protein